MTEEDQARITVETALSLIKWHHYILKGREPVAVPLLTWARWFEDIDNRRVAWTEIGDYKVSTVFLGIDHGWGFGPPILFETMIHFDGGWESETRYTTWDEAMAGHEQVCERLRESG